jgi:uncharacterized membrane protein YdjX (TVP38/TMEM64 family)
LIKLALFLYVFGVLLIGILLPLSYTGALEYLVNLNETELKEIIGTSKYSEIIFIFLQFVQVTFLPIPSTITTVVGAVLFEWSSVIYTLIGLWAGSFLAFWIGRIFGKKAARWIVGQEVLDKYYARVKGRDKTLLFLMFLLPFFPDDVLCLIAGLTNMKFRTFVLMMVITRPPQVIGTIFVIIVLQRFSIPFHGWGLVVWIVLAILVIAAVVLVLKYSSTLERWMTVILEKLTDKKNKFVDKKIKPTAWYKRYAEKKKARAEKREGLPFYRKIAKTKEKLAKFIQENNDDGAAQDPPPQPTESEGDFEPSNDGIAESAEGKSYE